MNITQLNNRVDAARGILPIEKKEQRIRYVNEHIARSRSIGYKKTSHKLDVLYIVEITLAVLVFIVIYGLVDRI